MNTFQHEIGVGDIRGVLTILKGLSQFVTIKVEGNVDNNKVVVLIDDGTTHNFIDEEFIRKKGFKTQ